MTLVNYNTVSIYSFCLGKANRLFKSLDSLSHHVLKGQQKKHCIQPSNQKKTHNLQQYSVISLENINTSKLHQTISSSAISHIHVNSQQVFPGFCTPRKASLEVHISDHLRVTVFFFSTTLHVLSHCVFVCPGFPFALRHQIYLGSSHFFFHFISHFTAFSMDSTLLAW